MFGEQSMGPMGHLTLVRIGEEAEINLFELPGNTEADRQTPMFGRGRLDHLDFQLPRWTHSMRSAAVSSSEEPATTF